MASSSNKPSLGQIAQQIFEDALHNIVHDIVLHQHRDHKLMLAALDPATKLPHCDQCKLPRLLEPPLAPQVRGATADPPRNTEYCDRKPWSRRPGHDIYDNPFPKPDATGRPPTKKEREAAKNSRKGPNDNAEGTPASEEPTQNTRPPSPSENGEANDKKMEKGEKKAIKIDEKLKKGEYVPWHTCPSCKRSLLITRFAKHLEQCMGLSGRTASRNAMAKMNGSTPGASRAGTPNPNQDGGGRDGEDDEDDIAAKAPAGVRKKLLKKGLTEKIKKTKDGALNGKVPKSLAKKGSPAGADKRERDDTLVGDEGDEDDIVHVKKRQKMTRVGSTASIATVSTSAAVPMGVPMDRSESGDGSFVDDASLADD